MVKSNDKGRPAPKGPWDVPVREFEQLMISVTVFNGDDIIKEESIDYSNYEHRKFLGRISYWAYTNGYVVETSKSEKGRG